MSHLAEPCHIKLSHNLQIHVTLSCHATSYVNSGTIIGNCSKFYFTFSFDIQMWDQIYRILKRNWEIML